MNGYLLDTDHCIAILNGAPQVSARVAESSHIPFFSCVFVEGELLYMVLRSEKVSFNLQRLRIFLENLRVFSADRETAQVYARLKKSAADRFGPSDKARRQKFNIETLGLKENDLWIASVALHYDLTLLSADSDFERLGQVEGLRIENWRFSAHM